VNHIHQTYHEKVDAFVGYLLEHKLQFLSDLTGVILTEFGQVLRCTFLFPAGIKKKMRFYGANPKNLVDQPTILFLHGDHHNQSAAYSLAKKIHKEQLNLFTLNLPNNGQIQESDREAVKQKIEEIKSMGLTSPLYLIGHSRGATLAHEVALQVEGIAKIIKLGPVEAPEVAAGQVHSIDNNVYEIYGKKDVLVRERSNLKTQFEVESGHLGLLSSSQCHEQILKIIKET